MKKRFIAFLIMMLAVFLCSCTEKEVAPVLDGLRFTANINYYNEKYVSDVSVSDNRMSFTVLSPEDLSGLKLDFNGDKVTAEYMGLKYEPKTESMPVGNVAQKIYGAIEDVIGKGNLKCKKGNNVEYNGRINGKSYKFTFSPSGLPIGIQMPDDSFSVAFENIKLTK